ncbi:MAG: phage integrase central domain-containing protein, partial [Gaiellaceae bacterium]
MSSRQRASTGGVRETRTKRGIRFQARYRVTVERDGVPTSERIFETLGGDWEGWTRETAEQHVADQLALVRMGKWTPPRAETRIEVPADEPSFHVLASEYVERRRREVDERTSEQWRWALSLHLLPWFADRTPSEIGVADVKRYMLAKQAEREERDAEIAAWRRRDPTKRGRMPARGLSNASINKTLKVLATVLDEAVDEGHVT